MKDLNLEINDVIITRISSREIEISTFIDVLQSKGLHKVLILFLLLSGYAFYCWL
jgi:hypothetical protein